MSARERKTPDWEYWRLLRIARDWEATALSLGIDPPSMKHVASWMGSDTPSFADSSFLSPAEKDGFNKRFRLLKTAFARETNVNVSAWNRFEVVLAEFAAWCVEGDLDVPPKFAELATNAPSTIPKEIPVSPRSKGARSKCGGP